MGWAFEELYDQVCTARRLIMQNARSHSSVFMRPIQVCERAFALHQEKKRDHFRTAEIDVHRMFHHDSTALTTRASGLSWTSAGLPHIQGVHKNLRKKPVDPSSPLQNTIYNTYCFMHTDSLDVLFWTPQCG